MRSTSPHKQALSASRRNETREKKQKSKVVRTEDVERLEHIRLFLAGTKGIGDTHTCTYKKDDVGISLHTAGVKGETGGYRRKQHVLNLPCCPSGKRRTGLLRETRELHTGQSSARHL